MMWTGFQFGLGLVVAFLLVRYVFQVAGDMLKAARSAVAEIPKDNHAL